MNMNFMPFLRTICAGLSIAFVMCIPLQAQEVVVGDTKQRVIELYGSPKGIIAAGGSETLSYDFGDITVKNGFVVETDLLPRGVTYTSIGIKQAEVQTKQREDLAALKETELAAEAQRVKLDAEKAKLKAAENIRQDNDDYGYPPSPAGIQSSVYFPPVLIVRSNYKYPRYNHRHHKTYCPKTLLCVDREKELKEDSPYASKGESPFSGPKNLFK